MKRQMTERERRAMFAHIASQQPKGSFAERHPAATGLAVAAGTTALALARHPIGQLGMSIAKIRVIGRGMKGVRNIMAKTGQKIYKARVRRIIRSKKTSYVGGLAYVQKRVSIFGKNRDRLIIP